MYLLLRVMRKCKIFVAFYVFRVKMCGVYRKLEAVRIEMQLLGGKIARLEILDFIGHEGRNQVILFLNKHFWWT